MENNKKLIVYFSYTGNTRMIANKIKEKLNCDILEIKTVIPYSDDYDTVVNDEQNSEASNHLPQIQDINCDLSKYDEIILGTPVWWGIAAWPVNTFVKDNDFTGKTVIPFCTSSSSEMGQSGKNLETMANGGTWLEGRRFSSSVSDSLIKEWTDSLK